MWNCQGCDYYVDLLNLSPDILNHLPGDTKRVLGGKSWRVKDEPIQRLLFQVVSNHYRDYHLSNGVQDFKLVFNLREMNGTSKIVLRLNEPRNNGITRRPPV